MNINWPNHHKISSLDSGLHCFILRYISYVVAGALGWQEGKNGYKN